MKRIELDKNLLYEIYVKQNHTIEETTEILNKDYNIDISFRTVKRNIRKNHFEKDLDDIQQSRENTIKEKYGVTNPGQIEGMVERINNTKIERYGTTSYNNREKARETCLEKYGVDSYSKTDKFKDTVSNLDRSLYKDKWIQTNLEKYGVPYYCMTDKCRNSAVTTSKPNLELSNLLKEKGIDNELEFSIGINSYDIHILNTNILLEINPTPYHNQTWHPFNKIKSKEYHQEKSQIAKQNGYQCIQIWDWDNLDKIISLFSSKEKLYARKLELKEVSKQEANEFLDKYHLQNKCNGNIINLGLYKENELVELMTFGKPRYNKEYEYELLRLCTKSNYIIVGGAERLFNHFIIDYKPISVISYCDTSKFTGEIYNKLGMKQYRGNPSKHWYNIKTKQHITDNLLKQRGFDQLFNTNYGKGTSNEQLMLENGFVEIYDCGQDKYIYKSKLNI